MNISEHQLKNAEQILIDNGIEADEASTVLEALGFALLNQDIYSYGYRAKNIQWDRTDDDGKHVDVDLPSEVVVTLADLNLYDYSTDSEVKTALAEYLVDNYGFCHEGFVFEKADYRDNS